MHADVISTHQHPQDPRDLSGDTDTIHPGTQSRPFLREQATFARVPEDQLISAGHPQRGSRAGQTQPPYMLAPTQGLIIANVRYGVCLTRAPRHTCSYIYMSIYADCDISPTHINTGNAPVSPWSYCVWPFCFQLLIRLLTVLLGP